MFPPESRFTHPSPSCEHPEWWHSADADSAEEEVSGLVAAFVRALQPEIVVETGTAFGHTTRKIGAALAQNGHGHCYSLELDPSRAERVGNMLEHARLPVTVVCTSSLEWTPPGPVDLAFLDSDLKIRRAEFERYKPRFVIVHDTAPHHRIRHQFPELVHLPTPRGVSIGAAL